LKIKKRKEKKMKKVNEETIVGKVKLLRRF